MRPKQLALCGPYRKQADRSAADKAPMRLMNTKSNPGHPILV